MERNIFAFGSKKKIEPIIEPRKEYFGSLQVETLGCGNMNCRDISKLLYTLYGHHLRRRGRNIDEPSVGFERLEYTVYLKLEVYQMYRS